jgi:predicted DNA-binding mobile mystery protein A
MGATQSNLKRRQLDDALQAFRAAQVVQRPRVGWARAIREALGMTQSQLGARIKVSRQALQDLEHAEAERRITLDSLDRLAEAMHCRLVYALVPKDDSLEELRAHRASSLAQALLKSADHSMKLEAQGLAKSELERQRELLVESLLQGSPRKLWKE